MKGFSGSTAASGRVKLWTALLAGLSIAVFSPLFAQQEEVSQESAATSDTATVEEDEEEDDIRVEENVFTPSEEISQDNAVPFPVDI